VETISDNIGTVALLGADGDGDLSSGRGAADLDLNRRGVARRDAGRDDHVQQVQAWNFRGKAGEGHFGGLTLDQDSGSGERDARDVLGIGASGSDTRGDGTEAIGVDQNGVADFGGMRLESFDRAGGNSSRSWSAAKLVRLRVQAELGPGQLAGEP
jgi:hypothetical protein